MSLVVVGLNHRTVPVEPPRAHGGRARALPKALQSLARRRAPRRGRRCCRRATAPRSTPHATLFHPAMHDVRHFLADSSGVDPDEFADLLYTYHDDAAVAHLFGVAAGLDSMIIGEDEILGQVREAWNVGRAPRAPAARCCRARSVTRSRWASGPAPRPPSAVTRCRCRPPRSRSRPSGSVRSTTAGSSCSAPASMGEGMAARARGRRRARDRRRQPHRESRRGASPIASAVAPSPSTRSPTRSIACDVLLVSTGAQDRAHRAHRHRGRDGRRDRPRAARRRRRRAPRRRPRRRRGVRRHPARHRRPAGLRRAVARAAPAEIGQVREIIAEELDRYRIERTAREVAPIITSLREHVDDVRADELERSPHQARRARPVGA